MSTYFRVWKKGRNIKGDYIGGQSWKDYVFHDSPTLDEVIEWAKSEFGADFIRCERLD